MNKFWKSDSCRWPQCGCRVTPRECYVLDSGSSRDKSNRQYGDAFEFWWQGHWRGDYVHEPKAIAWEAWKASAARSAPSAIAPTTSPSAARNRHIEGFRALNDNWNSYGSEKLPEATIQLGLRVSDLLNDEWKVIPCADGPSIWFYRGDEDEIIQVWASAPTDGGTDKNG